MRENSEQKVAFQLLSSSFLLDADQRLLHQSLMTSHVSMDTPSVMEDGCVDKVIAYTWRTHTRENSVLLGYYTQS